MTRNKILLATAFSASLLCGHSSSAFDGVPTVGGELQIGIFDVASFKKETSTTYWQEHPGHAISPSDYESYVRNKVEQLRSGDPDAFMTTADSPISVTRGETVLKVGPDVSWNGLSVSAHRTWSWSNESLIDADTDAFFRLTDELGSEPLPMPPLSLDGSFTLEGLLGTVPQLPEMCGEILRSDALLCGGERW